MTQQSQESGKRYDGVDMVGGFACGVCLGVVMMIIGLLMLPAPHIGQATVTTPDITVTGDVTMRGDTMTVVSDGGTYTLTEWRRVERVAPDGD